MPSKPNYNNPPSREASERVRQKLNRQFEAMRSHGDFASEPDPSSMEGILTSREIPRNRAMVLYRTVNGKKELTKEGRRLQALFGALKVEKPGMLQKLVGRGLMNPYSKSVAMVNEGKMGGKLLERLLRGVIKHPGGTVLGGLLAAQMVGQPLVEGVARDFGYGYRKEKEQWERIRRDQLAQEMRARRLQRTISENTTRLMTYEPELAQQILAGRVLPQGAVVIGGRPRTDLLAQVAEGMSMGQYSQDEQGAMGGLL